MAGKRASIFESGDLDLEGFEPKASPDLSAPSPAAVKAVSEAANFPSRQPARPDGRVKLGRSRTPLTGRNRQFNVKASQAMIDGFYAIADQQGWGLGETLEHALDALQQKLVK